MSSVPGGSDLGGANKDVEAEETTRNEDARAMQELDGDVVDNVGTQHASHLATQANDLVETSLGASRGETVDIEQLSDDYLVAQDYAQIEEAFDQPSPVQGSPAPALQFRPASTAGSDSIPDDAPSVASSPASTFLRDSSPVPRRIPSRTASGALQPFERRFESRMSLSPSSSFRANSPAFLSPHSRQISLSSQLSHISSQDDGTSVEVAQTPWEVVRWTILKKVTAQAFTEAGRRNFGRPTCLAVSALIAVGTSKGLILGFDYHQTLKVIIGQGTAATECGAVTSLAISADYSTIAAGHADGHIFTWEINRPSRPFLRIPPLARSALQDVQHPDGHVSGLAVLHIGFLATRHTALVSADAGGMAFSHLASRGLGPVTRTIKSTRLLGRYPSSDPSNGQRKPSSVLSFAPLPLGNVEQPTDAMGLTAMITPYLLVIVSTTPIAQTQYKTARPKDTKSHSTVTGCLAWFPAVKLKNPLASSRKGTSEAKLVYCWSSMLSVMELKAFEPEEIEKPPELVFHSRGRWQAEEAIVAVQWLGRSIIGVLTISQRLLIIQDGSLEVTDSVDLLHKHIYHQDLFSKQLRAETEGDATENPALDGAIANAYHMSFKAYKGRMFLLGFDDLSVGTMSNWADRLVALMEHGDHLAALRLATNYYTGSANNVTVGLPDADSARHPLVRERILAMINASLQYTFSQQDEGRHFRLKDLATVCFNACISMGEMDFLMRDIFEFFEDTDDQGLFFEAAEPYIFDGEIASLPPNVLKSAALYYISENRAARLEELLCRLEPMSFDLDQITTLCRQHSLYDALIYAWTRTVGDFVTPLTDLLSLIKILDIQDDVVDSPFYESAMKVYPYLAYTLTGRRYPGGEYMIDEEAFKAKNDVYTYLFAGRVLEWPPRGGTVLYTMPSPEDEPAFPYFVLLFEFQAASLLSMLNEAFEDSYLGAGIESAEQDDPTTYMSRDSSYVPTMTRQHIVSIILDVVRHGDFDEEQVTYVYMFIARTLSKYPGQLDLSGTVLNRILEGLCRPPSDLLRDDCQLSIEYLLSTYHPHNMDTVIDNLRHAQFFRVLKTVYRGEKRFHDLVECFFEDPDDKGQVFDSIVSCLRSTSSSAKQIEAIKHVVAKHVVDLADIDVVSFAGMIRDHAFDMLDLIVEEIANSQQQFIFLRSLLEPDRLDDSRATSSPAAQSQRDIIADKFNERYVELMCKHDPSHVAGFVEFLPSGNLNLERVLPAMEQSGVIDAAIVLLTIDGMAKNAMDRLVAHLHTLEWALTNLVKSLSRSPEAALSKEAVNDLVESLDKYVKVGIWLCRGQSKNVVRRPRPRHNFSWDIPEEDLDIDEFLWLNLVDAVVRVSHHVNKELSGIAVQADQHEDEEYISDDLRTYVQSCLAAIRVNVQQVFTTLLTATTAPRPPESGLQKPALPLASRHDNLSFLRVLRCFLARAATFAPSLAELREVLTDIFSAYTYEQDVLSLANRLLDADVFADVQRAHELRRRGWRPRSQVCEHCKRRAWGQGTGGIVWQAWLAQEQQRARQRSRKVVQRSGGEEARRLERGKSKASDASESADAGEEPADNNERRLELVVFACRHTYHRVCLDPDYKNGKRPSAQPYTCPLCVETVSM